MKQRHTIYIGIIYVIAVGLGIMGYQMTIPYTSVLVATIVFDLVATIIVFIGSIATNNSSVYDPYWSLIPPIIIIIWMIEFNVTQPFLHMVLFAILVWSVRLTTNWYKNFISLEHEDFRYVEFRNYFKSLYWVISFLGIHLFPTIIVFISMVPLYPLYSNPTLLEGVQWVGYIGIAVIIAGATISYVADEQLREHKASHKKETIHTGLWSVSRHPNYLGELMVWGGVLIIGSINGFQLPVAFGFIGMVLLFNFYSIPKMEQRLSKRKADYNQYKESVPRIVPIPFKR